MAKAVEAPLPVPDKWLAQPACPICGSADIAPFRTGTERGLPVHHDRCRRCLLVFQNPHPDVAWYDKVFAEHYWQDKARERGNDVSLHVTQWRAQFIRAARYLGALDDAGVTLPKGARVLEVGCAYGWIVRTLAERFGGTAYGVEPSAAAAESAKTIAGIHVLGRFIGDVDPNQGQFDLILFSHVIEYIVDINDTFRKIAALLRPGGILVIGTPNIFFRRATSVKHPYCFSKRALRHLFVREGFAPLRIEPTSHLATAFTPDYTLNFVGRRLERKPAPPPAPAIVPLAGAAMMAGHAWFRIANRFPVNRLLGGVNTRSHQLSADGERRLAELVARTNASA